MTEPVTALTTEENAILDAVLERTIDEAIRPATRFPLYVASTTAHSGMWKDLRRKWRTHDVQIVSSWIDAKGLGEERQLHPLYLAGNWIQNYQDLLACKSVLVYADKPDALRGALVEAGIAMGMHKPIILCGPEDHPSWGSWQYHPLVTYVRDLQSALRVVQTWMGRKTESPNA